jgi:hypothetical protein
MPAGIPNWYPQCNNTAAINTLTSITDMEPNPTVCNAALIAWLIENLAAAIPIGE